jgi:hypothetical protein
LDLSDFSIIFVIEKQKQVKIMFYIYEKNLNTNDVKVFMKVRDRNAAEHKVMEMNEVSLYDDKFYFIKEANE